MAAVCAAVNCHVLEQAKVRRLYNDGREVLLTATRPYDLIVSEPSNPYRAGVASLYTREYYRAARERLGADGLFLQWFQAYEVDAASVRSVLATLGSVFAQVEIWQTRSRDMLLVCSPKAVPYAWTGSPRAQALADELRAFSPAEAEAINAIRLARLGRPQAAGDAVVTTLQALRHDPWAMTRLVTAVLQVAVEVARSEPSRAATLYRALQEPFPVAAFEDKRQATVYALALSLGPAEIARSLAAYEPNVPWKRHLLQRRLEVYTALGSPRAAQARADWEWYRRQEQGAMEDRP